MLEAKTTSNLLRFSSNGEKNKTALLDSKSMLRSSSTQHKHLLAKMHAPLNKKSKF